MRYGQDISLLIYSFVFYVFILDILYQTFSANIRQEDEVYIYNQLYIYNQIG